MNQFHRPVAFFLLLAAASCREPVVTGSGSEKTEQRNTSGNFDKIQIEAPVDATIQVTPGATPSYSLSGYANVLPYIRQRVENGTLYIYEQDEVNLHMEHNLKAVITVPSLSMLDISGASDSRITGSVTGAELKVMLSGAGSVTADNIQVSSLDADMSGATDLTINAGSVSKASYDVSGSGDIHAFNLQTNESEVEVSGAGSAEVTASQKLSVDISGAGGVSYKGHPQISQDITGAGSVTDAN